MTKMPLPKMLQLVFFFLLNSNCYLSERNFFFWQKKEIDFFHLFYSSFQIQRIFFFIYIFFNQRKSEGKYIYENENI